MRKTIFFALLMATTAAQAQKLNLQRISSSWTMPLLMQEQPVFAEEQATEMSELSEEAVLANAGPRLRLVKLPRDESGGATVAGIHLQEPLRQPLSRHMGH